MQKKKWLPVALHILAWTLFFVVPHFMRPEPRPIGHQGFPGPMRHMPQLHSNEFWFYFSLLQNVLLVPFFYINVYYLFPRLLPGKRYGILLLVQAGIATALFGYDKLIKSFFLPGMRHGPLHLASVFIYLVILSVAYGYYLSREAVRVEQIQKDRENESLKAELQFLRWQVSPHFLFNALNNMVSLARKRSELVEPMLINLSGIMRYMLYETDEAMVTLKKEAQYLQSYISLQSMRFDNVKLDVQINVPDSSAYIIEPMLLIPFVENAFKHGIDLLPDPEISVKLDIKDDTINFSVANRYVPGNAQLHNDAHGIGLVNVKKRLTLLYDGKHTLQTEISDRFTISLKIQMNKCFTV